MIPIRNELGADPTLWSAVSLFGFSPKLTPNNNADVVLVFIYFIALCKSPTALPNSLKMR
jgi:hypothetical protein